MIEEMPAFQALDRRAMQYWGEDVSSPRDV